MNGTQSDLAKARVVLDRFNDSQSIRGGNDAMYRAVKAVAEAGSSRASPVHARSDYDFLRRSQDSAQFALLDEPWDWLATIAESAGRSGGHHLLASIAFFTFNWHGYVSSLIEEEDECEMRLFRWAPLEPRVRIYRAAIRGLAGADPGYALIEHPKGGPGGPYTITQVWGGIAINIGKEVADYPSDLQLFARNVLP